MNDDDYILVTGGAGFIGSHICLKLQESGYRPLVFDNFSNGHRDAVVGFDIIEGDIRDSTALSSLFQKYNIAAVIHMAGLIEAGVSVHDPAPFYDVNTLGSFRLLEAMRQFDRRHLVFSSTAALYGNNETPLLHEELSVAPVNPYGTSKAVVEMMLRDFVGIYGFSATALRYFNATGADPAGRAGERHNPESHLIPIALQAAAGLRSGMKLYGTDYDTLDGTCIRDYVHVDDLADAHVKAVTRLLGMRSPAFDVMNIGTGNGCSVRDILDLCRKITGVDFKIEETARRAGDPSSLVADAAKAQRLLGWKAKYPEPEDMIRHAWQFIKQGNKPIQHGKN